VNATDTTLARLADLITKGTVAAFDMRQESDFGYQAYHAWHVQALTCIADVSGPDGDYYKAFQLQTKISGTTAAHIGVGMLEALREDVANGYLRRTADLITAEVFGDFLEMANHLLSAGYHVSAASLVGAVLEDGLRRLAAAKNLKLLASDDISALNGRLASKGVYSNLVRKQVAVWADIRNAADHGPFDQVKAPEVREMHAGVSRFLAEQLG
jgi:hypothetical protein